MMGKALLFYIALVFFILLGLSWITRDDRILWSAAMFLAASITAYLLYIWADGVNNKDAKE